MSAVLEIAVASAVIVTAPYSQVHIRVLEADDHIIMRTKQLAACLRHMPVADYSEPMVLLLRKLADDLVQAVRTGDGAALLASQLAELMISTQGSNGPCDVLWLCQQLGDEIDATISGMPEEGGAA